MVYDKVLEGRTVRLRSIEERDAEASYRMRIDPEKSRYIHQDKGTVEDQRRYILAQREKPGDYYFIVEDLQGVPIGLKAICDYDAEKKTAESGRFIGCGSQIQNMEALMMGFDFAFNVLKVKRVIMSALEGNTWMLGIQKKFGAKYTHRHHEEGMPYDNLYSMLTAEDYASTRPKIEGLIDRFAERMERK